MTDWRSDLGGTLSAISVSPDGQRIVAGGRDVLRIVSLGANSFVEKENLRKGATKNLNLTTIDAQWHPHEDHLIATAATNGAIAIWNLNLPKTSKQERVLSEHTRTVNKVAWHRGDGNMLLSGSQDGTVKLWDLRMDGKNSVSTFVGKSESVRDIQFSPHFNNYYLAGFENGTVQIVDQRKCDKAYRRVTAHQGNVLTIAWHPADSNIFASAGRDRTIKMWRMPVTSRPATVVHTIASVSRICWRPNHPTHLASCNNIVDNRIHLWDFSSPHIPLASFMGHTDVPTGITWCPRDPEHHIISCSKDSSLMRHSLSNAHKPYRHLNSVSASWSVDSDILASIQVIDRDRLKFDQVASPEEDTSVVGVVPVRSKHTDGAMGFDKPSFVHMASHYKITSKDTATTCDHNATIASEAGRADLQAMWGVMRAMVDESMDGDAAGRSGTALPLTGVRETSGGNTGAGSGSGGTGGAAVSAKASTASAQVNVTNTVPASDDNHGEAGLDVTVTAAGDGNGQPPVKTDSSYLESATALQLSLASPTAPLAVTVQGTTPSGTQGKDEDLFDEHFNESHMHNGAAWLDNAVFPADPFTENAIFDLPQIDDGTGGGLMSRQLADLTLDMPKLPVWDNMTLVRQTLDFHGDLGDIQTCVFISLVFREQLASPEHDRRLQEWLVCYIELLQRLECFELATEMFNTAPDFGGVPNSSLTNAGKTTISTSCPYCHKPLLESGRECYRCKRAVNTCSICDQAVKGLYVWCQGCGHGGHLDHMREWFEKHDSCPAGCLHKCSIYPPRPVPKSVCPPSLLPA